MLLKATLFTVIVPVSCGCVTSKVGLFPPSGLDSTYPVYVITQAWHTGLVFYRERIPNELIPEKSYFKKYRYLEIGWGDKDFYQDAGDSKLLAIKAMIWPTDSVIHVVGFQAHPAKRFRNSEIIRVDLTAKGYQKMLEFIDSTIVRGSPNQRAPSLGAGLYGYSHFFNATGTFHLFSTCNEWTALALRAAGCPINTFFVYTADSVLDQAEEFGTIIRRTDR